MVNVVDQAIVLRTWDFSETSQTVSLLTRARGVLRGLAKGARRESARFGGGFETLTRGEIVASIKPGAELAALAEWDLQEVFRGVRRHLASHRAGLYLADLVQHAILDHDPHERIFDALAEALRALDQPHELHAVVLRFQWRLLTEIGYQPRLDAEHPSAHAGPFLFSAAGGGIVASDADHRDAWRVRPETVRELRRLAAADAEGESAPIESRSAERAGRLLSEYLRHALGRELPTRTAVYGEAHGSTVSATPHPNKR